MFYSIIILKTPRLSEIRFACICIFALNRPGSEKILLLSLTALPIAVLVHETALVEVSVEVAGGAAVEPPAGPVLGATITVFVLVVVPVLCRK